MRKRLRKKLRLGEFRELGFTVEVWFILGVTAAHVDDVFRRLNEMFPPGLCVSGGGGPHGVFVTVTRCDRRDKRRRHRNCSSATEADRESVRLTLVGAPNIVGVWVSELFDAHHHRCATEPCGVCDGPVSRSLG